jgi:hypothetical protein
LISARRVVPQRLEIIYNDSLLRGSRPKSRQFLQLADIFLELCDSSATESPVFIVLDALDEISEEALQDVTQFLSQCVTRPLIKIVATSRTTEQLKNIFPFDKIDHLEGEANDSSIKAYIGKELKDIKLDPQRKARLIEDLCADSKGL